MSTEKIVIGCLNCGATEKVLDIKTKLYNDFGGYSIYKDNEYFWSVDFYTPYDKCPTIRKVEKLVSLSPLSKWEIKLDLPLRSAVWERKEKNKWILTNTGLGFA